MGYGALPPCTSSTRVDGCAAASSGRATGTPHRHGRSWRRCSPRREHRSPTNKEEMMILDRFTKVILGVIAVALVVIALNPWLTSRPWLRTAEAQSSEPKYTLIIPKAWGRFVTYSNGNLLLEGSDGWFREVDLTGKPPEYPK